MQVIIWDPQLSTEEPAHICNTVAELEAALLHYRAIFAARGVVLAPLRAGDEARAGAGG